MAPAIPYACETQSLRRVFGSRAAVHALDLRVAAGELYGFLGENGAGKTTTLRMIAGLLTPTSGDARVCGHSITVDPLEAKRALAYLPDDPVLYGKLTADEYLEFVAALWNVPPDRARRHAQQLLDELGLAADARRRIDEYSRGMKQKLALVAALLHEPQVLLLDEPLTGLDAASARRVKDILIAFVRSGGAVILTTHILDVAERLAERIGIIHSGRLVAEGTLDELRSQSGSGGTLEEVFLTITSDRGAR